MVDDKISNTEKNKEMDLFSRFWPALALFFIIAISLFIRLQSMKEKYLLAYDPFYMERIAKEILLTTGSIKVTPSAY